MMGAGAIPKGLEQVAGDRPEAGAGADDSSSGSGDDEPERTRVAARAQRPSRGTQGREAPGEPGQYS